MKISDMPVENLKALSMNIEEELRTKKAELKIINDELAFRDNIERRAKALEGMSSADILRLAKLTQTVATTGIASAESVGAVGGASK